MMEEDIRNEHKRPRLHPGHHQEVDELVDDNFPTGYRFVPTDEELVECYLKNVVLGRRLPRNRIYVVYLYDYHPKELTGMYREHCENVWYFFTPRNRKYQNGRRPDRGAGEGYWKATNVEKQVVKYSGHLPNEKIILGFKRTLDYYEGKHPEEKKTDWKMNEYRFNNTSTNLPIISNATQNHHKAQLNEMVLCKIYRNSRAKNDNEQEVAGGLGGAGRHDLHSAPPARSDSSSNHNNNSNSTVNITNALPNNSNGENIEQLDDNEQVAAGGLGSANQSATANASGDSYSNQNNSNSIDEMRNEFTTPSFRSNVIPSSSSAAMYYTEGTSGMETGSNSIHGLFSPDEIKFLLDSFEN